MGIEYGPKEKVVHSVNQIYSHNDVLSYPCINKIMIYS